MLLELLRHHMLTDVLVLRIAYDDSYLMLGYLDCCVLKCMVRVALQPSETVYVLWLGL
ncbi:hypothetical protein HanPI659440_Chr02g0079561 [Helianthus annuus]|nr:hypothetical protein HanPI659440_Chr02g0079561 [Helianthus annuus]